MAGCPVRCQWYQSDATVTGSFKLRPSESRGQITAKFQENYCAVYDGGELYWEVWLADLVIPAKCKLVTHVSRAEVKLEKARRIKWEEFEVAAPLNNGNTAGSAQDNMPWTLTSPLAPITNTYVPEDLMFVKHVSHDFLDVHDCMKVRVQVAGVLSSSCKVSFSETSMEAKFQTRNAKFLRMFEDHSKNTFFVWKIKLFGKVVPSRCSWKVHPNYLEILLSKLSTKRWKTLLAPPVRPRLQRVEENPAHSDFINELPDSVAITEHGEELVGSNWNDLTVDLPVKVADETRGLLTNNLPSVSATPTKTASSPSNLVARITTPDDAPTHNHSGSSSTSGYSSNASDTSETSKIQGRLNNLNNLDIDMPYDPNDLSDLRDPSQPLSVSGAQPSNTTAAAADASNYRNHPIATSNEVISNCTADSSSSSAENNANFRGPPLNFEPTTVAGSCDDNQHYQFSSPSFTGLANIGNSCFMSSVVQCLSNTESLRRYFTSGQFRADVNTLNPLGFKGQLAICFFDVIRDLWSGEYEYCSLRRLKQVVSSRSESFGGYQQQDSHEFMSYLLDGLHEDLNRVRDKPVTSLPEGCGLADSVLAEKAWQVHRERNDSFFVDNFQGQFKSTLVCPACQKVSVTFDPFMSLSVPISRNLRCLPIFFVAQDPCKVPLKLVLELPPDANLELLKASVARKTGISMVQLRMFEIFNNKFHNLLSRNQQPISSIGEKDVIIVSEVATGRGREEVVEINMIQRVKLPLFPTKCTACGRHSDGNKKLQRCSKCKAVGYCDRECQGHDWAEHKMKCRSGRPTPVGLPFVVSMTAKEFTYSRLASMAEQFARRSVDVVIQPTPPPDSEENTDGIQGENTGGGDKNTEGSEKKQPAMYLFVPVDRYGDNKETTGSLEDSGDAPLSFRGQYLAMDWQNDSKGPGSVKISPKSVLDHKVDRFLATGTTSHSLPSSRGVSLDQCIELFTQPETLSKEEAWYCSKCKEHREATKQISIWRLPPILIIHLKRFSYSGNFHRDKLKDYVEFPLRNLDMTPFMLGEASSVHADASPIYDLYATVNHCGAVYMGHYISQVKPPSGQASQDKKTWLLYDDANVRTIKEEEVVDSTAYLLFYRRREGRSEQSIP